MGVRAVEDVSYYRTSCKAAKFIRVDDEDIVASKGPTNFEESAHGLGHRCERNGIKKRVPRTYVMRRMEHHLGVIGMQREVISTVDVNRVRVLDSCH